MSAFLDGYAGLELELPNGRTIRAKCLPLARAAYFLQIAETMAKYAPDGTEIPAIDPNARFVILAEFPKAVELLNGTPQNVWDELTIAEFWVVFWGFFGLRVKREPSYVGTIPTSSIGTSS